MDPNESLAAEEVAEIEKHKYFLSEKAGHDVGWEFAVKDWRERYGVAGESRLRQDAPQKPRPSGGLTGLLKRWFSRGNAASI
jgi:hypothetical protein